MAFQAQAMDVQHTSGLTSNSVICKEWIAWGEQAQLYVIARIDGRVLQKRNHGNVLQVMHPILGLDPCDLNLPSGKVQHSY